MNKLTRTLSLICTIVICVAASTIVTKVSMVNSTINSTTVGATTPSTGAFTSLTATSGTSHTLVSCNQDTLGTSTGTGGFVTMYSCTVPGNTILAGQGLEFDVEWTNASATACAYQLTFGGTTIASEASFGASTVTALVARLRNTSASQSSQIVQYAQRWQASGSSISPQFSSVGGNTLAINTTASQTVLFQENCPGTVTTIQGVSFTAYVIQ